MEDLPQYLTNASAETESSVPVQTGRLDATEAFFASGVPLDAELESYERRILLEALKRANGVQKRAAELLAINYRSLRHRLDKYQILSARTDPTEPLEDTQ